MGQPVKLSDALIADARLTGELSQRSIAGQIEFWAQLGRAAELLLNGAQALALRKAGDAVPLSQLLSSVDLPGGHARLSEHLATQPFPHYEPCPGQPGVLVRVEADGTRTKGQFVEREFRPLQNAATESEANRNKPSKQTRSRK